MIYKALWQTRRVFPGGPSRVAHDLLYSGVNTELISNLVRSLWVILEIVVVDGEEVVTTESIKQSTLIGAEASKRGLCFHCAAFR